MVTEKSMTVVDEDSGEITTVKSHPLMVTPEAIQQTQRSLALLQELTKSVLKSDRDYGTVPGVQGDFLWDPGAAMIASSFNCHPGERRMIHFVDNEEVVSVVVEVPLVSFVTGQVVATGIGAASTKEVKYKYRWEKDPREWGYNDESIKSLRTREKNGIMTYRIPNPEHGELVNTIVKMASKRAEVDAVETLPGVSSALRELFDRKGGKPPTRNAPDWKWFWSELNKRGIKEKGAHELLGVKSFKELLDRGKSLEDILSMIDEELSRIHDNSEPEPAEPSPPEVQTDPDSLKNLTDLYNACNKDFGMQPSDVVKELGYPSQMDITETPPEAYRIIKSARS